MIVYVDKGVLWEEPNAQIIYNPVSISKSVEGQNVFNSNLKHDYRNVYESYREYMIGESKKRLLGDVQLVQIQDKKFIMNGFIYDGNILNLKAVMKTFVELSNLAEEYKINVALSSTLGTKDKILIQDISKIINTVFSDCKSTVYVYNKRKKKHRKLN